jgi:hypothetical protein
LLLPAASRVTWGSEEGTAAATLNNGTAVFSTASGGGPTVGRVSIVNSKELRVSCSRGSLAISVDDDTKTVAEGTAYRVVLDPNARRQHAERLAWRTEAAEGSRERPIFAVCTFLQCRSHGRRAVLRA